MYSNFAKAAILTFAGSYLIGYHMAATTHKRTSMSLDPGTLGDLDELAKHWAISKSEVMRRAIRQLRENLKSQPEALTPLEALDRLQNGEGISSEVAEKWMKEVRDERNAWRDPWKNR
jgi:predicted transcriptional regulator